MGLLDKIGTCVCSCGICCSKKELCDNCRESTMRANGLPIELADKLIGVDKNGWNGSDASFLIKRLVKEQSLKQ